MTSDTSPSSTMPEAELVSANKPQPTTTTEAIAAATTVAPATTTAPAPATTTASAAASGCESFEPDDSAVGIATTTGDWDGDGTIDTAQTWGVQSGEVVRWFIQLTVNEGSSAAMDLGEVSSGSARVIDRFDVDYEPTAPSGTNRDEILAVVGGNASGLAVNVFGLAADTGCIVRFLAEATSDLSSDDGYYQLIVGGRSGIGCQVTEGKRTLTRLTLSDADDGGWQASTQPISRYGTTLFDGEAASILLPLEDPEVNTYTSAGCNGVAWLSGDGIL